MRLEPPLDRRFRLIAFDWDGTAVVDRQGDASKVRGPIERLLRCGVLVVVISGTNHRHIDAQLSRAIDGPHKRRLYLATNRGSEVYGFDAHGEPALLEKRVATPGEEALLTSVADAVRAELAARTGLELGVVYDRLNRRKIDLIPEAQWKDPPKADFGRLLEAVESRLTRAGLAGLAEAFAIAERLCRELGLRDARVTSDVKHLEIGLTDKADSMGWVLRSLARPLGIETSELLVGGDEFGRVAGFPGSDGRLLLPEAAGAVFVSVGAEPDGVPAPVLHLSGGPARFLELLESQAALHPVTLPASPSKEPDWLLVEPGYVLTREHEVESLTAIGNGLVGTRGSLAEGNALSAPATFVAGLFEPTPGGDSAPALAKVPDWTHLAATIDGEPIRLDAGEPLFHRRTLDLRQGILWREWKQRSGQGRVTTIHAARLVSLADRHLLFQSVTLTPENYSGQLVVQAPLVDAAAARTLKGETVGLAVHSSVETPERYGPVAPVSPAPGQRGARSQLEVERGGTYRLDRIAALHTSRDCGAPVEAAAAHLARARGEQGAEGLVEEHRRAWEERWRLADVRVEGDAPAQQALRFAAYHLLCAANPDDERSSVGARGLTGPAYKGHVFWDTDIYMLPFYCLAYPEAARAHVMYRYHTLPAARARAARLGYRGALYAWESADTGEDVTPPYALAIDGEVLRILNGTQEQHISADVAYGVWSYWHATGDERFLIEAGAEVLVETARFWASRVKEDDDARYHIRGVIGPDEYHESVDDNAYTNGMAQWNLERGAEVAALLERRWPDAWHEQSRRLGLTGEETRRWLDIAARLHTGLDPRTGLIEQFRGYFRLEEADLLEQEPRVVPMDLLLGRGRVQRTQIVKQPDVVMLLYLLWDRFSPEVREANFRYYEPRCDHGSSLSPPIHAAVAARLGDLALAERYFRQTCDIDLANNMGNAAGGVHLAAQGGLWQAAVFGFAGLELGQSGPVPHPRLPPSWRSLGFSLLWRGLRVEVKVP
ncbi:MAG: glycoside hydrolase family 65 protein [Myxococcaceae bacterium]